MQKIAIIVDNLDQHMSQDKQSVEWKMVQDAEKIYLIYIENQKWFPANDPQSVCASLNSLSSKKGIERMHIITHLKNMEFEIKKNNRKVNIVKMILLGAEKYKIKKCILDLHVDMVIVFFHKKQTFIQKLFTKSTGAILSEELSIPVLLMKKIKSIKN